ncbi:MAG: ATP-binding protein [Bacteroidales bacterium]|nr:ATP-binding protein [Bacteroidales bacterium]
MKYTVKNFKIFNEQGATFDIAPITMLTGCNCSGKSSLVKSMLVLGDYLSKVKSYLNTVSKDKRSALAQPLDFAAGMKDTGGFDNVLNEKNTNGLITFQYTVDSKLLMEKVTVTLSFEKDSSDVLGRNGRLKEVSFQREDGKAFYKAGHQPIYKIDLDAIKDAFIDVALRSILMNFEDKIKKEKEFLENVAVNLYDDNEVAKLQEIIDGYSLRLNHIKKALPVDFDYRSKDIPAETKKIFDDILKQQTFGDDDIVALYKYNSVLYLPWLSFLKETSKENVREVVEAKLMNAELSEEENICLNFVLNDFDNSSFNNFYDYYMSMEKFCLAEEGSLNTELCAFNNRAFVYAKQLAMIDRSEMNHSDEKGNIFQDEDVYQEFHYSLFRQLKVGNFYQGETQSVVFLIMAYLYGKIDPDYAKNNITNGEMTKICGLPDPLIKNNIYNLMQDYAKALWDELLVEKVPVYVSNITHIGSNRAIAQRLYSFDKLDSELNQQIKTNIELQNMFEKVSLVWKEKSGYYGREGEAGEGLTKEIDRLIELEKGFIGKWLQKFEICDTYSIETVVANGVTIGCSISLEKNGKKRSIADEGYGCIQIFTVLLAIQNLAYKGFIDFFKYNKSDDYVLAVEEPENHLHPKLQSLLADMFLEASKELGVQFIVETHSEYLIRKSQVLVKKWYEENKDKDKECPFQAYYIPSGGTPYSLGYRQDGKFAESFGPGFYDESANLTFEIM